MDEREQATGNEHAEASPPADAGSIPAGFEADLVLEPEASNELPITSDLPCLRCAYSLRGLKPTDLCPECGLPVLASIDDWPLFKRSEDALRRERRGAAFVQYGMLAAVLTAVLGFALQMLIAMRQITVIPGGQTPQMGAGVVWSSVLMGAMISIPLLFICRGWWLMGVPEQEPRAIETASARSWLRVCAIIVGITIGAELLLSIAAAIVTPLSVPTGGSTWFVLYAVILTLQGLAQLTGYFAYFACFFASMALLIRIGQRGRAGQFVRRVRRDRIAIPIVSILLLCVMIGPLIGAILYYLRLGEFRGILDHALRMRQNMTTTNPSPASGALEREDWIHEHTKLRSDQP